MNMAAMDEESSFSDHDSLNDSNDESINVGEHPSSIPRFCTPKTSNVMANNAFTEGLMVENEVILRRTPSLLEVGVVSIK